MLVGFIEDIEWKPTPHGPTRITIRHRSPEGKVFEVHVDATSVEVEGVPTERVEKDGKVTLRIGRADVVARVDGTTLRVHPRGPRRGPGRGSKLSPGTTAEESL